MSATPGSTYLFTSGLGSSRPRRQRLAGQSGNSFTDRAMPSNLPQIPEPQRRPPNTADLLVSAISNNDKTLVSQMLADGIDVNTPSQRFHLTPLGAAINIEDSEMLKLVLDNGADPNQLCNEDGESPLYAAAVTEKKESIRLLILAGANPDRVRYKQAEDFVEDYDTEEEERLMKTNSYIRFVIDKEYDRIHGFEDEMKMGPF